MTSKWLWKLQGQRYPIYVELLPASPKIHSVLLYDCSFSRYREKWGFWFLHRLQWWIWNFRKKNVKNRKLKISNIPNIILWGPLGGNFRKSLKTFGCDCSRSSVLQFSIPYGPMLMKTKKQMLKSRPQLARIIEKIILEKKFDKFWLWFVE